MLRRLRRFEPPSEISPDLTISPVCRVVRNRIEGEWIFFAVLDPKDTIQRQHIKGQFYEPDELDIIRRYMPPNAIFCDIGANIGNHSIYVLKYLEVRQSILFEPNPTAISLLRTNIGLNGLTECCDMSNLGFGLADKDADGLSVAAPDRNLGGAKLVADGGNLKVRSGDAMLEDRHVDFVKVDVEGMEIEVLKGLKSVIARCRPTIFIEVDSENADTFHQWVADNAYVIRERFQRYEANENFLLTSGT